MAQINSNLRIFPHVLLSYIDRINYCFVLLIFIITRGYERRENVCFKSMFLVWWIVQVGLDVVVCSVHWVYETCNPRSLTRASWTINHSISVGTRTWYWNLSEASSCGNRYHHKNFQENRGAEELGMFRVEHETWNCSFIRFTAPEFWVLENWKQPKPSTRRRVE